MDWSDDGLDWPNRRFSRFVDVGAMVWHVQERGPAGDGPTILFLHGSGATTHSMVGLVDALCDRYRCFSLDLPGHGFSTRMRRPRPTLEGVSDAIHRLLKQEGVTPDFIVGHSAGAAIGVQMLADAQRVQAIVSINGAFYPFPGMAGQVFPAIAKLLFLNPFVPRAFSFAAQTFGQVESLIDSTGSKLDEQAMEWYRRALASPHHVEGTLSMMANWDLHPMAERLRNLPVPLLQIIGTEDGTIDPKAAEETKRLVPESAMKLHEGKGHLVHEEAPDVVAAQIHAFFETACP
ncbi:MAG: alpha/beta fold hydrolase BchO [Pseudomonadota bacterium]